jgi:hypothetical protein
VRRYKARLVRVLESWFDYSGNTLRKDKAFMEAFSNLLENHADLKQYPALAKLLENDQNEEEQLSFTDVKVTGTEAYY